MKRKRPPLERDIDKAAAWLRARLAEEQDAETHKRLRLAFDTLNRYRWTADEFVKWWQDRDVDAPPK